MRHVLFALTGAVLGLAITRSALADEPWTTTGEPPPAVREAVEVTVAGGYAQGFGKIRGSGRTEIKDVAVGGIALDLGIGYRMHRSFSVQAVGQYAELTPASSLGAGAGMRTIAGGVAGTYHFAPAQRFDPWLSLGAGYRALYERYDAEADATTHGFELARLVIGVDVRSGVVAIAPIVGADANLFVWDQRAGTHAAGSDAHLNTFVFFGIGGRFDIGADVEPPEAIASARR